MEKQEFNFKYWLLKMTTNLYLPLFIIFFTILVCQLLNISNIIYDIKQDEYPIISSLGYSLPLDICLFVVFKGFIQFGNDLKNNKTR